MVPARPGFMGRPGCVLSSTWKELYSSTENTTVFSGRFRYNPTTSSSFSLNNGSLLILLVDPHLWHPDLKQTSPKHHHDAREALIARSDPVSGALLTATMGGSFLHTSMEADDELREKLSGSNLDGPIFIATDGEIVFVIPTEHLSSSQQKQVVDPLRIPAKVISHSGNK